MKIVSAKIGMSNILNHTFGFKMIRLLAYIELALLRAKVTSEITWTPLLEQESPSRRIPRPNGRGGYYPADVEQTGVIYSSTQYWQKTYWLNFEAGFQTFLSAVMNTESVLYTEDIRSGMGTTTGANMGFVCSSFLSWCFDLGINVSSSNWSTLPGVMEAEAHNADNAKIGSFLQKIGHVALITDVQIEGESVTNVTITEASLDNVIVTEYTASNFNTRLTNNSEKIYHISNIDALRTSVPRIGITPLSDLTIYSINTAVLLDMGDRCSYKKGDTVKFNIINENADSLIIKKDGVIVETITDLAIGVIQRTYNYCGNYTAYCIMNDLTESQTVFWSVSKFLVSVPSTVLQNDPIEISFLSIINCKPIFVASYPTTQPSRFYAITKENIDAGKILIQNTGYTVGEYIRLCILAETKYGRIHCGFYPDFPTTVTITE